MKRAAHPASPRGRIVGWRGTDAPSHLGPARGVRRREGASPPREGASPLAPPSTRIGTASRNRDGSLDLRLDYLPADS
jgi:hypothetical protein